MDDKQGMDALSTTPVIAGPTTMIPGARMAAEADAERLIMALETLSATGRMEAQDAEKHGARLQFSLGRLRELRASAMADGGVFAPARAEVALAILEGHTALAASFISASMRRARRAPGRRELRVQVDEALALVEEDARAA